MTEATGQIVQVTGGVVDVSFEGSKPLPYIFDALEIPIGEGQDPLVLRMQKITLVRAGCALWRWMPPMACAVVPR